MKPMPVASDARIPTLQFSTDMFAPRDRLAAWREFIGRGVFKFDIEPLAAGEFNAQSTVRILPGLRTIESIATASRHARPRHLVSDDDLLFGICRVGTSQFTGCGRDAVVGVGDAVLMGGG